LQNPSQHTTRGWLIEGITTTPKISVRVYLSFPCLLRYPFLNLNLIFSKFPTVPFTIFFSFFKCHFLTFDFYLKKILDLQDLHKAKHFREDRPDRGSSSTLLTYAFGTTQQRLDITIQVQHLPTYCLLVN
jgi:hypothetical protein